MSTLIYKSAPITSVMLYHPSILSWTAKSIYTYDQIQAAWVDSSPTQTLSLYANGLSAYSLYAKPIYSNPYGFGSAAINTTNVYLSDSKKDYNRSSGMIVGPFICPKSNIKLNVRLSATFGMQNDRNGVYIYLGKDPYITGTYMDPLTDVGIGNNTVRTNFSGVLTTDITNIPTSESIYAEIDAYAYNNAQSTKNATYSVYIYEIWLEG